jgi:hypothetical protein
MDVFDKLPYELRENVAKMVWTEAHSRAIHRRVFKYSLDDITTRCNICGALKRNSRWTTCGCRLKFTYILLTNTSLNNFNSLDPKHILYKQKLNGFIR